MNNAAATTPGDAPEEVSAEQIDEIFAVNANAPFLLAQRALGLIPDGGRIVNISSAVTRMAMPPQVVYAMSKGALDQLTLHFARHLALRRITVNSVLPGATDNGSPAFRLPEVCEVGHPEVDGAVVGLRRPDRFPVKNHDGRTGKGSFLLLRSDRVPEAAIDLPVARTHDVPSARRFAPRPARGHCGLSHPQ